MKALFAVLAGLSSVAAYAPYLTSMFSGSSKPHAYTWLIWTLSTGTAAAGLWYGHAGVGAWGLTASATFTGLLFLFSLKYGTRDITKTDAAVLAAALLAIGAWIFLKDPLLSVIMVTAIDLLGYIPTYRKLLKDPGSESGWAWVLWAAAPVFSILALEAYNALTLTYVVMVFFANLFALLLMLRKSAI
jgi:hypothetical protein